MKRILAIVGVLSLVATGAIAFAPSRGERAFAQGAREQLVLTIGDSFRVEGAAIGCQVSQRGGRAVIECRRGGDPGGTYGTFLSDRTVKVARFRSERKAQTILTARHGGSWRACETTARPSRIASLSRGCR